MDSWERFNETSLTNKENFYSLIIKIQNKCLENLK